MEKQIRSTALYEGKVVTLLKDEVELDDGTKSIREVVKHHGGAAIALRSKDGRFYMVKQYRYAQGSEMIEFCAGKLNEGEDPTMAVVRETAEELGFKVNNLHALGYIVPTCGYSSERIYLYYGEEGEFVGEHFDEDERIDALKYSLEEIEALIACGKITDAKTICTLYRMKQEKLI